MSTNTDIFIVYYVIALIGVLVDLLCLTELQRKINKINDSLIHRIERNVECYYYYYCRVTVHKHMVRYRHSMYT